MGNVAAEEGRGGDADYRYELRRGDEVIATGHFSREQPLEIGERITMELRSDLLSEGVGG